MKRASISDVSKPCEISRSGGVLKKLRKEKKGDKRGGSERGPLIKNREPSRLISLKPGENIKPRRKGFPWGRNLKGKKEVRGIHLETLRLKKAPAIVPLRTSYARKKEKWERQTGQKQPPAYITSAAEGVLGSLPQKIKKRTKKGKVSYE